MICFRDQSYCAESAECANTECNRKWTDKLAALEAENKRQALVIEECREALESPPARMIHKAPEALAAIKAEKMFYEGEQGNKLLK